jgi:hypothetical protein
MNGLEEGPILGAAKSNGVRVYRLVLESGRLSEGSLSHATVPIDEYLPPLHVQGPTDIGKLLVTALEPFGGLDRTRRRKHRLHQVTELVLGQPNVSVH